jgi:cytoskeletal protein RodZ
MDRQEPFYHNLKQLRVAQGIFLEDIAAKARINFKFLEALENGHFDILPPTYIRLFLRSYCQEIGSDFDEVVEQLEDYTGDLPILQNHSYAPALTNFSTASDASGVTKPGLVTPEVQQDRGPARLRRDFLTGATIFAALILITVFARKSYDTPTTVTATQQANQEQATQQATVATEPSAGVPTVITPTDEQPTLPVSRTRTTASRSVVPTESTVELGDELFAQDRITSHLLERVRLTPPVRLTLMARDNVVIQPVVSGSREASFNLTVAEARQWSVNTELILRTSTIQLLRGDLNGVPINFGTADGLGALRVTPTGVYEVSSYNDGTEPETLE